VDRKKDVIISGGMNIYSNDIENILKTHPEVMDVAVIGIPHKKWGETPLALVIPKQQASVSADELKEWVNKQLATYQRISAVEFRDSFPRNILGKVLKRVLREPYWKEE
jgi:acyl-CoA synthetase (AMP-forming)/AMP-acid ligase II